MTSSWISTSATLLVWANRFLSEMPLSPPASQANSLDLVAEPLQGAVTRHQPTEELIRRL